ncbi:MAG TPA: hypothetical protein VJY15_21440 [Candidatus Acidoferrum sp.]|nr:hypothetical protein [Candidatus Acidoferrum sp.]
MSYSYRVYGLGIDSTTSIAGPESVPQSARRADLFLETGPETEWARHACASPGHIISRRPESEDGADPSFQLIERGQAECFELVYSDGARFVVDADARRVWGTFRPPLTNADLATYFLGPVLGFILRRWHVTSLHASAVEFFGQAVAFSGDAGFGKSTTAAALALRGVPVLSEDISPMRESAGRFHLFPGYPRVCLWPDSVVHLLGSAEALPRLTPVWGKRFLSLDGVRARFSPEALPLGLIYLFAPRSDDADAPRVEEMRPREALLNLVQNTYMNWLLDREQRAVEFDTLSRLVQQVPVRRLIPHRDAGRISALCELIQKDAAPLLMKGKPPLFKVRT